MWKDLTAKEKAFVQQLLLEGFDPIKAYRYAYSDKASTMNDTQINSAAKRIMNKSAVMSAVDEKKEAQLVKHQASFEVMLKKMFELCDQVSSLPADEQNIKHLRFILDVYKEINKMSGNHTPVIPQQQQITPVQINFIRRQEEPQNNTIDIDYNPADDLPKDLPNSDWEDV